MTDSKLVDMAEAWTFDAARLEGKTLSYSQTMAHVACPSAKEKVNGTNPETQQAIFSRCTRSQSNAVRCGLRLLLVSKQFQKFHPEK
jgi:hypothetical protein